MPPLIAAIGPILAAATAFEIAMTVASIGLTVGTTVFGMVAQKKAAKKAKRQAAAAREDFLNSLQERTVTRIATEAPHRYVYGKAKVGADVVAVLQSGANDEYKHLVCIHAAGESESIDEVYINNKPLGTLDADGFVTSGDYYSTKTESITETFATSPFTLAHTPSSAVKVIAWGTLWSGQFPLPYGPVSGEVTYTRSGNTITVTGTPVSSVPIGTIRVSEYRVTYQYANNTSQVRVKKHLGAPDDPADTSLLAECPDKWKDTAVLRGFTYTVIRLDLRQAEFQNGLPDINVLMKGRKLYDPRTGLTAWSSNPALAALDYLTSEMCGIDIEDIPIASYITAANVCDEQVQGLC
jgi:mRNA-degrading endonuclease RelE of RelBE toxin-antitoxin system